MLTTQAPTMGLLFGSFLFRKDRFSQDDFISSWQSLYGESFILVPEVNPLNEYYSKEMGEGLARIFLLSATPFPRETLLSSKLQALHWEAHWSEEGKRTVNVDTGFLSSENFLLATTKNYSHRVYLGQNIFADLTYDFHQGELRPFPWTYPDYLDSQKKEFFSWGRSFLLEIKRT